MIWYLLFCTTYLSGSQMCIAPTPMPSRNGCQFIGAKMTGIAQATTISWECVGVRKEPGA
jgi:hypothetical protein